MILSKTPILKTFGLRADEEGKATVTIRQANNGDEMEIAKLGERQRWVGNDNGETRDLEVKFNYEETKRLQVRRVLAGTTDIFAADGVTPAITFRDGANGQEVAKADEFNAVWAKLPSVVADEIYEYVLDVNPQWDNSKPGK